MGQTLKLLLFAALIGFSGSLSTYGAKSKIALGEPLDTKVAPQKGPDVKKELESLSAQENRYRESLPLSSSRLPEEQKRASKRKSQRLQ